MHSIFLIILVKWSCRAVSEPLPWRTVLCVCSKCVCVLLSAQCQLQADTGIPCADYVQVWFFDKNIGACSAFWYGGCGGNANRFNTENECFQTCGRHSKSWLYSRPPKTRMSLWTTWIWTYWCLNWRQVECLILTCLVFFMLSYNFHILSVCTDNSLCSSQYLWHVTRRKLHKIEAKTTAAH